ncbi:hypothetical protein LSH36_874g01035 [Paralvinella palmiformis]|uniref:Uncharacterized protein n=1 Tax=Paralvinella palmiformis TaxID=53620 RepID=A0AAD9IYW1_9ANNE|nr:hypothetical protein LSH36_874g01035 [Paralvinella palmiformis]
MNPPDSMPYRPEYSEDTVTPYNEVNHTYEHKLTDKTLEKIVTVLKDHFQPKPSACSQRNAFNTCFQSSNQKIADYVAQRKSIARDRPTFCEPLVAHLQLNGESVAMEVGTGAAASIMSEETFLSIWPKSDGLKPELLPINKLLKLTLESEVIQQTGPLSLKIPLEDNRVIRRHVDHIRLRACDAQSRSELDAPHTEERAYDVPLNVSEL